MPASVTSSAHLIPHHLPLVLSSASHASLQAQKLRGAFRTGTLHRLQYSTHAVQRSLPVHRSHRIQAGSAYALHVACSSGVSRPRILTDAGSRWTAYACSRLAATEYGTETPGMRACKYARELAGTAQTQNHTWLWFLPFASVDDVAAPCVRLEELSIQRHVDAIKCGIVRWF